MWSRQNPLLFQYVIDRQTHGIVGREREVEMDSSLKKPKIGAGARLREFYNNLRKRPMSPELNETLKKKDIPAKDQEEKKIARSDREAESS